MDLQLMTADKLKAYLEALTKKHTSWDADMQSVLFKQEKAYSTVEWSDSGVGEDYVLKALQMEYPDTQFEIETEGGCDTCGYGRRIILTIYYSKV